MTSLPVVNIRANDISFLGLIRASSAVNASEQTQIFFDWKQSPIWHSEKSKYFDNYIQIVNPAENANLAVEQLVQIGEKIKYNFRRPAVVLCSSDVNEILFQNFKQKLEPFFFLPGKTNDYGIQTHASDKGKFYNIIHQHLPELLPKTLVVEPSSKLDQLKYWKHFPCILKPSTKDLDQSFYRRFGGLKALLIESPEKLKDEILALQNLGYSLILQEYIPFRHATDEVPTYCYFDANHNLKIYANGVKKLIHPPKFGTALVLELSYDEELFDFAATVGKALKWYGPLMIEFVRDPDTRRLLILEVNTRPWLFHDFYRQCGLPFISSFLNELAGNEMPPEVMVPSSKHRGGLNVDLQALAKLPEVSQTSTKSKSAALKSILKSFGKKNLYSAHLDFDDPNPFFSLLHEIIPNDIEARNDIGALFWPSEGEFLAATQNYLPTSDERP